MPVTRPHKDFNCKHDNTGPSMPVVPHTDGNRPRQHQQKKNKCHFTGFSKTLFHYIQNIFACM